MGGASQRPLASCSMIVRDEAHNLEACFEAAAPLVDEWIVVDTGSTDGTAELAERLGAKVSHVPWCDDFSFSRNASLEPATGTWTIVLDGDDRLEGAKELRAFLEALPDDAPEAAFAVQVQSPLEVEDGETTHWESLWQPRIFRTSAGVRYRYPVHNIPILDGLEVGAAPGRVRHIGYTSPEARIGKAERTLRLLEKLPEGDPHRLYHHIRALAGLQRFDDVPPLAAQLASKVEALSPDIRVMWAQALLAQGSPQQAIAVLAEGLGEHPHHPDLFYVLLTAAGVGYAGSMLRIRRGGGLFEGVALTLDRAPAVVRALVDLGALDAAVLDSDLIQPGPVEGSQTHWGEGPTGGR
jgi:hypothetical protein